MFIEVTVLEIKSLYVLVFFLGKRKLFIVDLLQNKIK